MPVPTPQTLEELLRQMNREVARLKRRRTGVQRPEIDQRMGDLAETLEAAKVELEGRLGDLNDALEDLDETTLPALRQRLQEAEDILAPIPAEVSAAVAAAEAAKSTASEAESAAAAATAAAGEAEQAALAAAGLAESKGEVIRQASPPTGSRANSANLWIRSSDNRPHVHDGNDWVPVTDQAALDAAADAAAAAGRAEAAESAAQAAQQAANAANDRAQALEGQVSRVAQDLADAEEGLNLRLGSAEGDLSAAQGRLDTAESSIADAFGQIGDVDIKAEGAATAASAAQDAASTAQGTADQAISDAESKAAAAQQAAQAHAEAQAEAARLAAIAAASDDADAKAAAAQAAAEETAAADALEKANAAQAAAEARAQTAQEAADAAAGAASQAQSAADAAQARADQAHANAGTAQSTADAAMTAAGTKTTTTYSDSAPAGTGQTSGDTHRQWDGQGNIVGEWRWNAPSWVPQQITSEAISNLDVGKLTAGSAEISDLVAQEIAAASGQFIELDVDQLTVTGTGVLDEAVVGELWSQVVRTGFLEVTERIISGEAIIEGSITANEINAQSVGAAVGEFLEVKTDQLIASDAGFDTAVANQMFADMFTTNKITAVQADVGSLEAALIRSEVFEGKEFYGGTFTGSTIRTAQSGKRVELSAAHGIRAWNAGAEQVLGIDSATGNLTMAGDLVAGSSLNIPGVLSANAVNGVTVGGGVPVHEDAEPRQYEPGSGGVVVALARNIPATVGDHFVIRVTVERSADYPFEAGFLHLTERGGIDLRSRIIARFEPQPLVAEVIEAAFTIHGESFPTDRFDLRLDSGDWFVRTPAGHITVSDVQVLRPNPGSIEVSGNVSGQHATFDSIAASAIRNLEEATVERLQVHEIYSPPNEKAVAWNLASGYFNEFQSFAEANAVLPSAATGTRILIQGVEYVRTADAQWVISHRTFEFQWYTRMIEAFPNPPAGLEATTTLPTIRKWIADSDGVWKELWNEETAGDGTDLNWTTLSVQSGWATTGGPMRARIINNIVYLEGEVYGGRTGSTEPITTLPQRFRPNYRSRHLTGWGNRVINSGGPYLALETNGRIFTNASVPSTPGIWLQNIAPYPFRGF